MDRKKTAIGIAIPALLAGVYAWAAPGNSITMQNKISTGAVNISLEEYQEVGGKEESYQNNQVIVPGQTVSKIPEIRCLAEPCYVRCSIQWELPGQDAASGVFPVTDGCIQGIGEGWVEAGGYWYYTKALGNSESVRLFDGIRFPEFPARDVCGQEIDIVISADAIQAANFTPDFKSADPWDGSGKILGSWKTRNGSKDEVSQESPDVRIFFKGDAEEMVTDADSLFHVFGEFMPGDVKEGKLLIQNTTGRRQRVYLSMGQPAQDGDSLELLGEVNITVSNGGDTIYDGAASGLSGKDEKLLGIYEAGGGSALDFKMEVPGSVDNSLALTAAKTDWTFRAEAEGGAGDDTESQGHTDSGGENKSDKNNKDSKRGNSREDSKGNKGSNSKDSAGETGVPGYGGGDKPRVYAPETGDAGYVPAVRSFACMVLGFITAFIMKKRKRRAET